MQITENNQKLTNIAQRALGNAWIKLQEAFFQRDPDLIENAMWIFASTTCDQELIEIFERGNSEIENDKQIGACHYAVTKSESQAQKLKCRNETCGRYRKLCVSLLVLMKKKNYINFYDGYNPISEEDFDGMDGEAE